MSQQYILFRSFTPFELYKRNPILLWLKGLNLTKERGFLNGNVTVSHSGGNLSSDSGLILAKEFMVKFEFSRILRKNIQIQDDRLYHIPENESILKQIIFQLIAGYSTNSFVASKLSL